MVIFCCEFVIVEDVGEDFGVELREFWNVVCKLGIGGVCGFVVREGCLRICVEVGGDLEGCFVLDFGFWYWWIWDCGCGVDGWLVMFRIW